MEARGFLISWAREALSSATASSRSVRRFRTFNRSWPVMSWKMAVTDGAVPCLPLQDGGADPKHHLASVPVGHGFEPGHRLPLRQGGLQNRPIPGATVSTASTTSLPLHSLKAQAQESFPGRIQVHEAPAIIHRHDPCSDVRQDVPRIQLKLAKGRLHLAQGQTGPPDPVTSSPVTRATVAKRPIWRITSRRKVSRWSQTASAKKEEGSQDAHQNPTREGQKEGPGGDHQDVEEGEGAIRPPGDMDDGRHQEGIEDDLEVDEIVGGGPGP